MQLLALFAFLWMGVLVPSAFCQTDCAIHGRDGVSGVLGRYGLPGPKGEKGAPGKKVMCMHARVENDQLKIAFFKLVYVRRK